MEGAYEAHDGPKAMVRYEDLVANTLGGMRRVCSGLGIAVDEGELAWVVGKHAWEIVPEREKGAGKFRRKATPGGWAEDLSPELARTPRSDVATRCVPTRTGASHEEENVYGTVRNARPHAWLAVGVAIVAAIVPALVAATPEPARAAKGGPW